MKLFIILLTIGLSSHANELKPLNSLWVTSNPISKTKTIDTSLVNFKKHGKYPVTLTNAGGITCHCILHIYGVTSYLSSCSKKSPGKFCNANRYYYFTRSKKDPNKLKYYSNELNTEIRWK